MKYLEEIFIHILLSCLTVDIIMNSLDYQFNIPKTAKGEHKKINYFFIKTFVGTSVIYFHIFYSCFLPYFLAYG